MSYKMNIENFKDILAEGLEKGKESKLLYRVNENTFYEVNEHISYVEDIEKIMDTAPSTLKLLFSDGQVTKISAYTNKSIYKGCFVSTLGYFYKTNLGIKYRAVGGINKVITRATEVPIFGVGTIYRMGIISKISKVEKSKIYTLEDNPIPFGIDNFYYIQKDIEKINTLKELDKNSIDTQNTTTINTSLYDNSVDEEDYTEVEEDTEEINE